MITALVLCLGMLPTAVWAVDPAPDLGGSSIPEDSFGTGYEWDKDSLTLKNYGPPAPVPPAPGPIVPPPPAPTTADNVPSTYPVKVDERIRNGEVRTNLRRARENETVTLTVRADEDFVLQALTVKDRKKEAVELTQGEDGSYTFKMPASSVVVDADFVCVGGEACPSYGLTDVPAEGMVHEIVDFAIRHAPALYGAVSTAKNGTERVKTLRPV